MVSSITHTVAHVQEKVRFLEDYFDTAVALFARVPQFHVDNHELLLGELCFHLVSPGRKVLYVEPILSHEIWRRKDIIKSSKSYKSFERYRRSFLNCPSSQKKHDWLDDRKKRALLLKHATSFHRDLKRWYLRKNVDELVSYLGCVHDLEFHLEDMCEAIRCIVSLHLLDGQHEKDLRELIHAVISRDIKKYPFPRRLVGATKDRKQDYLDKLTLKEQFRSLAYLKHKPRRTSYYVFRCFGIKAEQSFLVRYPGVEFMHGDNARLVRLRPNMNRWIVPHTFLESENCIYAVVRASGSSPDSRERVAFARIRQACEYLRSQIGEGFHLDLTSHLTTADFTDVGGRMSFDEGLLQLGKGDQQRFRESSFALLARVRSPAKTEFLRHEPLFYRAILSGLPSDYWVYAEVLLSELGSTQRRIERLAHICALGQEVYTERLLCSRLWNIVAHESAEQLGIRDTQSDQLYSLLNRPQAMVKWLEKHVHLPIVKVLVQYVRQVQKLSTADYERRNAHTWIRAYGQRNALLHANNTNEKTTSLCLHMLPTLVRRLRANIVQNVKMHPSQTWNEVITSL